MVVNEGRSGRPKQPSAMSLDPFCNVRGHGLLQVFRNISGVFVSGAVNTGKIIIPNIIGGAGVVHVIDQVLIPPGLDVGRRRSLTEMFAGNAR